MIDTKASEAACPRCQKTATHVSGLGGWLFKCACGWKWGHPQLMTYTEAINALNELRIQRGEQK